MFLTRDFTNREVWPVPGVEVAELLAVSVGSQPFSSQTETNLDFDAGWFLALLS